MEELIKLIIGVGVLLLGIPIGTFLKSRTLDEIKDGRKWFKLLTLLGLLVGFGGLIFGKDWIMFSAFFVSVVSSQSLRKLKK